jgi:hypothetical protein
VPFPTKENHIWNVAEFGDDKCTIHPFDKGYVVGWLYVGVYGFSDSEFSINVRWKNRGEGNGPSSSSRQQTGLSAENSYDSIFSQVPLSTPPTKLRPPVSCVPSQYVCAHTHALATRTLW